MKETRKIIPFVIAAGIAAGLFAFNPPKEAHLATIKTEYVEGRPTTWRATWWNYERSLAYRDYLFFSVVKRKHRPKSLGCLGMVITLDDE